MLVQAGRVLTREDLERLGRYLAVGLRGGDEWPPDYFLDDDTSAFDTLEPMDEPTAPRVPDVDAPAEIDVALGADRAQTERQHIPVDSLHVGQHLSDPIYSDKGVLLLPAGVAITPSFLTHLRKHRIFEVQTRETGAAPIGPRPRTAQQTTTTRELDRVLANQPQMAFDANHRVAPTASLPLADLRAEAARARSAYTQAVLRLEDVSRDIFRGRASAVSAARDIGANFLSTINLDRSLLPAIVQFKSEPGEYLFQHGLNVALVAMTTAARAGLPAEHMLEIGLGALLQDVGMLQVPEALRMAPRKLTTEELQEVRNHPIYTLNFLERMDGLSETAMIIAYQAHERGDCTGYPRKRHRMLIHPYARVVAAADTFVAISSHRPFRPAGSAYRAMVTLLNGVASGCFDRNVVATMLDCLSLFPIGSYVRLSTGNMAKVSRANPGHHTKPVVIPLNADGSESDVELDLARSNNLRIVKVVHEPTQSQLSMSSTPDSADA